MHMYVSVCWISYLFLADRETGDTKAAQKLKPFGTPLVSLISHDDVITRGDIQKVVHTMLSPLLRSESLRQADIPEPCSSLAASDMCHHSSSDEACTNPLSDSMNKDSSGSRAVTLFKLPLQLVEESNACIDLSVGEDKTIKLSSTSTSMLVYVDWSQELLEKYDIHYLENLPEVFKYGPVNKKARTEPLSLYTCLEGFLREEPLVPEDMWLVSILPQRTIFNCNADQSLVDISLVGIFLMHLDVIELFILHVEEKGVALKD